MAARIVALLGALLLTAGCSASGSAAPQGFTLGATLHGARITDPLQQLALGDRRYADFDLNATWLWTEHWTLQLQGAYFVQRLISTGPSASSTSVYLNLLRQFGRIRL